MHVSSRINCWFTFCHFGGLVSLHAESAENSGKSNCYCCSLPALPSLFLKLIFHFHEGFTVFQTVFVAYYHNLLWQEWSTYTGGTGSTWTVKPHNYWTSSIIYAKKPCTQCNSWGKVSLEWHQSSIKERFNYEVAGGEWRVMNTCPAHAKWSEELLDATSSSSIRWRPFHHLDSETTMCHWQQITSPIFVPHLQF